MYNELKDSIDKIQLNPLKATLFAETAQTVAQLLKVSAEGNKDKNTTTQLRRFYDELVMWDERIALYQGSTKEEKFEEFEPFIQMIRAKAAYALGRGLVSQYFVDVVTEILKQVKDPETLHSAKVFFEAVMGFKKSME